jgi:hypothetical protein
MTGLFMRQQIEIKLNEPERKSSVTSFWMSAILPHLHERAVCRPLLRFVMARKRQQGAVIFLLYHGLIQMSQCSEQKLLLSWLEKLGLMADEREASC